MKDFGLQTSVVRPALPSFGRALCTRIPGLLEHPVHDLCMLLRFSHLGPAVC